MLDTLKEPPARLVAQMRAIATQHKLPAELADELARHPVMTAERAETLAPIMKPLLTISKQAEMNARDFAEMVSEVLEDAPDMDAGTFRAAALDKISMVWKSKGDIDIPMHGRDTDRAHVGASWDGGEGFRAKMVAGLTARMSGKTSDPMARDAAQFSIPQIAMQVCRLNGLRPFNDAEAVRMAAHSTSDFPLILENSLTNRVARELQQHQPAIVQASHEVRREDYRSGKSLTLSATGMPMEVNEGGEIKFVTAEENGELMPTLRDFASGFNITNQALQNDSTALNLLNQIGTKMVQGAVERWRRILIDPLLANTGAGHVMADGKAVFHADHGNLASSGAAPDVTTLSNARLAMRRQMGLNGEILALEPWGLVVPPELETKAQQVLAEIEATKFSDVNPFANSLALIVEPGLANGKAWYLVANPARYDGLAHAFLEGNSGPRVETRPGWTTLGLEMRLIWALDARFIEYRTWYRNPGE